MTKTHSKYHSIVISDGSMFQDVLIVLLASALLGVISQVAIHLWWTVPVTLQSAMVIFLGLTLGSKRAAAAVAAYLIEGALGAPVFAGGYSGFIYLMGPTGGYLWGFLPAAFITGFLMERGMAENFITSFIAAILGSSVIFLFGAFHLQLMIGWKKAYEIGVEPFLLIEPIKLIVASLAAVFFWKKN